MMTDYIWIGMAAVWISSSCLFDNAFAGAAQDTSGITRSITANDPPSNGGGGHLYQRYPVYHPYCSDPAEMKTRSIPPLEEEGDDSNVTATTRLVHASIIIRHGARTPTHGKHRCWDGYWDAPQGEWNCTLQTRLIVAPLSNETSPNQASSGDGNMTGRHMLMMEKVYDALDVNSNVLGNELNGTCQAGQLIVQGYPQQITNGEFLRKAYVYNKHDTHPHGSSNQDPRLRLFDTSDEGTEYFPFEAPHLRLRSDEDQRTIASGQVLLSSMFDMELQRYREKFNKNPIIPLHIADRSQDILSPPSSCQAFKDAESQAKASDEYVSFNSSEESTILQNMMVQEFGVVTESQDCLMTTMCTDRPLPDVINDYGRTDNSNDPYDDAYGSNRFERLTNHFFERGSILLHHNDSALSKINSAALWAEILDFLEPSMAQPSSSTSSSSSNYTKLSLFSAHDSTVAPLMASLGTKVWNRTSFPYYATMMIIEIHEVIVETTGTVKDPTQYAFRLVYNGNVLTSLIDDCPKDRQLCDISILLNRIKPIANRDRGNCTKATIAANDVNKTNGADTGGEDNNSTAIGNATAENDGSSLSSNITSNSTSMSGIEFVLSDTTMTLVAASATFILSMLVGCIVTWISLRKRVPTTSDKSFSPVVLDASDMELL